MTKNDVKTFIRIAFFIIVAFAFGGTGLAVLFNSRGDLVSVIGGFVLLGIAISLIYNLIENG